MTEIEDLFRRNRRWVEETLTEDPDFFQELARGQAPSFLVVGCSDSRKCPNIMLGTGPGDLFVHRNIANQVLPDDGSAQAILEFAILTLEVPHVVVMGHTRCGGVGAALQGLKEGSVGSWLRDLRSLADAHAPELDALPDGPERADRLAEINVVAQVRNVLLSSAYGEARERGSAPAMHGWMFDLSSGYVRELELPRETWREEGILT